MLGVLVVEGSPSQRRKSFSNFGELFDVAESELGNGESSRRREYPALTDGPKP